MEVGVRLYREAFARTDAALAVVSPQGDWLAVNPSLCRLLGQPADALLGTRAHEAVFDAATARRIAAHRDGREAIEAAGKGGWRITLERLDGDGGDAATLLCVEAAQVAGHGVQDPSTSRLLEHLAYGISHDLRAPLRGIAGFAAKLEESGAIDGADAHADLARIRAAAVRAECLVDGLLELLRATRQPLHDDVVDISLLCEWVAAELQDADPARATAIEIPPGLSARGDEHWLKVLLHHVFDNAWKFSAGRERVEIAVEGRVEGERLRLAVRDRGCGFDMRYADKLFLPFQRLHGAEQGGGNGLGLAIAQQLAQRHGGAIHAQSTPGEGSTFFIELPAAPGRGPDGAP